MTNNEIKAVTNQWLKSKGFVKGQGAYKAFGNCYVHPLPDFDVYIIFSKDRFSEMYYFEIGFQLRNNLSAWGHLRARIPQIRKGSYSAVDSNGIYG